VSIIVLFASSYITLLQEQELTLEQYIEASYKWAVFFPSLLRISRQQ